MKGERRDTSSKRKPVVGRRGTRTSLPPLHDCIADEECHKDIEYILSSIFPESNTNVPNKSDKPFADGTSVRHVCYILIHREFWIQSSILPIMLPQKR